MTFMLINMMLIRLRKDLELRSLVKLLASPNPPSDGWGRERYRQMHDICAKVVGIKVSILFHCLCISSVTFLLPACEENRCGWGGGKACLACGQSWRCRFSLDFLILFQCNAFFSLDLSILFQCNAFFLWICRYSLNVMPFFLWICWYFFNVMSLFVFF